MFDMGRKSIVESGDLVMERDEGIGFCELSLSYSTLGRRVVCTT